MDGPPTRYASIDIDVSRPPQDRYQLLGHLGTTPFADIYLARMFTGPAGWQEFLLERLRPGLQNRPGFVDALAEEAIRAASLRHEGIASTIEVGELESTFFITTELIRGVTLRELHRRAIERGDAIPMQFALKIATDALMALSYAHEHTFPDGTPDPIIHANITPETAFVTYKGVTKLVDFGLGNAELSASGRGLHSPYAAPEQGRGQPADVRSDLFSLGLVLLELVINRLVDEDGSNISRLVHSGESLQDLFESAQLPPAMSAILERALGVEPRDRYASAAAMRKAIDDLQRERARPASQENLGRFVQDLFSERLKSEERARLNRDDLLLVKSMQIGSRAPSVGESRAQAAAGTATERPEVDILIEDVDSSAQLAPDEDEMTVPGEPALIEPRLPVKKEARRGKRKASGDFPAGGRVGRYTLLRRLGFGSMAEVFLARTDGPADFQRLVAVKRILPQLARDKKFVELFMSEARLCGRLVHPNVVEVFDFGCDDDGQYFIAMEYVEGWDLATVLNQCRARKELVPIHVALRIMSQVCVGLHAGHSALDDNGNAMRIVHRDVCPQNILLSSHGHVKLTDFGIAKANDSNISTQVGEIRGKPAYMAPERVVPDVSGSLGRPGDLMPVNSATERADIFSVGVVLFEVVTMVPLFRRDTPFQTLMAAQRDPVPPMSMVRSESPKVLDGIVARATSRWPNERYPSALSLQNDLEQVLDLEGPVSAAQVAAWLTHLFATNGADELSTEAGLGSPEPEGSEDVRTAVMKRPLRNQNT